MFYLNSASSAKRSARSLEKFLKQTGVSLSHGQALNALGRIAGFEDWNGLAASFSFNPLTASEQRHAEDAAGNEYGDEMTLLTHTGFSLRAPSYPNEVDYVRIVDPSGQEIAYWVSDEWQESPQEVMGALLGALQRSQIPKVDELKSRSKKVFAIRDVPFNALSGAIIAGEAYNDVLCLSNEINWVLTESSRPGTTLEVPVLRFTRPDEEDFVEDLEVTLSQLQRLRWDEASACFLDENDLPWKFFVNHDVSQGTVQVPSVRETHADKLLEALERVVAFGGDISFIELEDIEALIATVKKQ